MQMSDGSTSTGGFLLGTDPETYQQYIESSICQVAEINGKVVGFAIILPDEILRKSEVWMKRNSVQWTIDLQKYEEQKLCFFEQFAFLPGNKKSAVLLGYHITKHAFDKGFESLFTTTVNKPVVNLAALPFIHAVDGIFAGKIDEVYPFIGEIKSDIYVIEASKFNKKVPQHPLYSFFQSSETLVA